MINGYSCYPQDPQYYDFLGEAEVGDARYLIFYEKMPDYAQTTLRIPDEKYINILTLSLGLE